MAARAALSSFTIFRKLRAELLLDRLDVGRHLVLGVAALWRAAVDQVRRKHYEGKELKEFALPVLERAGEKRVGALSAMARGVEVPC